MKNVYVLLLAVSACMENSDYPIQPGGGDPPGLGSSTQNSTLYSDMIQIGGGRLHGCRLHITGVIECWGSNARGQLGIGQLGRIQHAPQVVTGGHVFTNLWSGGDANCGTADNGTGHTGLWCWGAGSIANRLGTDATSPTLITFPTTGGFSGMGPQGTITRVAVGTDHACAAFDAGDAPPQHHREVWCWGKNDKGQLGDGTTTDSPGGTKMDGMIAGGQTFAPAAGGTSTHEHTCVISVNLSDQIQGYGCTGSNAEGQLGTTITDHQTTPTLLADTSVHDLSAGDRFSCSASVNASSDMEARCWGDHRYNHTTGTSGFEDGTSDTGTSPTIVVVSGVFSAVSTFYGIKSEAGAGHTCFLAFDESNQEATYKCWGEADIGQLGYGGTANGHAPISPLHINNFRSMSAINNGNYFAVGSRTSYALQDSDADLHTGFAYGTGSNINGETGTGDLTNDLVMVVQPGGM